MSESTATLSLSGLAKTLITSALVTTVVAQTEPPAEVKEIEPKDRKDLLNGQGVFSTIKGKLKYCDGKLGPKKG